MLEVKIAGEVVDASDFDALRVACHKAVLQRTAHNVEREDLLELCNSMTSLVFATSVGLGALLMLRAQAGMQDEALAYLRQELAVAINMEETAADEPRVILP